LEFVFFIFVSRFSYNIDQYFGHFNEKWRKYYPMDKPSTTQDRLALFISHLGISERKFSESAGLSHGLIGAIKKGTSFGVDKLEKILVIYPDLNVNWLVTGKGSMLVDPNVEVDVDPGLNPRLNPEAKSQVEKYRSQKNRIPLYDTITVGGTGVLAEMNGGSEPAEMIDAGDWFRDSTGAMRVHGESMYPKYQSGSIVVFKEVKNRNLIVFGEDYIIETSEYRIIKRIQKGQNKDSILACSYNEESDKFGQPIHQSLDIDMKDITRIFRVLGCVIRNESSRIVYTKH
jgi:phage repressor protein C with HTH and peptisase S24 domain